MVSQIWTGHVCTFHVARAAVTDRRSLATMLSSRCVLQFYSSSVLDREMAMQGKDVVRRAIFHSGLANLPNLSSVDQAFFRQLLIHTTTYTDHADQPHHRCSTPITPIYSFTAVLCRNS